MNDANDRKSPKKPLLYYYGVALLIIILLNALIMPALQNMSIVEVSYNTFISDLNAGKIKEIQVEDEQIAYLAPNDKGRDTVYVTGNMNDPNLTSQLLEADVSFDKVIPNEGSPILNFLLGWILPIVFFVVIGQLLSRFMMNRMGGNAMTFGKSNCQGLCGGPNRQKLCRRSRRGRGQRGADRNRRFPARAAEI